MAANKDNRPPNVPIEDRMADFELPLSAEEEQKKETITDEESEELLKQFGLEDVEDSADNA